METDRRDLFSALIADGRPVLSLVGLALLFSGAFAIFQSCAGELLPHDLQALGIDAQALVRVSNPHLLHFMFHDRVAFGGTLLAIGSAYLWLAEFPLKAGAYWAWWAYLLSGATGFISFLSYLGYGYLDQWHFVGTVFLMPLFAFGLYRARSCVAGSLSPAKIWRRSLPTESTACHWGRLLLLACAGGFMLAGIVICLVGMTVVFVPQDLRFFGLQPDQLRSISPMLIPVIAHDRAGFGGGLLSTGLVIAMIVFHAPVTKSFVELMILIGVCGFGAALGVHLAIGYLDLTHLAPAYLGAALFFLAIILCSTQLRTPPKSADPNLRSEAAAEPARSGSLT